MATNANFNTRSTVEVLRELQAHIEALYTTQRQESDELGATNPLKAFQAASRAHGIDHALRLVDAALIKCESEVQA